MLPLSLTVSLLLLLSSLSLQALALQGRSLQAVQQRRRLVEDRLMEAAQQVAGALQRQHRCLLPLADQQWEQAACVAAGQLAALRQGEAGEQGWQLLHYRPEATSTGEGEAEMLVQASSGGPAAAFALRFTSGDSPRLLGVQELGLRSAATEVTP
jgi:hypothetical protein